jgi:integrase
MNVYRRGKNWYIGFRFHGERYREMIGPSRKGAETVIAKRKAQIAEGKFLDIRRAPVPITFYDLAKEYRAWAKTNKKASTCSREVCIMRSLDAHFKGKHIHEITTRDIEEWKSQREKTCKPASVNRELALLKHMLSMAVRWKSLKESPAKEVKRLKGEGRRVRYLMPDEVQTLLSSCKDWLRPVLTLAVHTGMRKGELLSLTWPQVNLEQGIITLLDTKNGERRDIPMDETVKGILKEIPVDGELVFSNRNGKRIDGAFLYLAFYEALKKSGITDFRFHDLRHTFASNLIMSGMDLNTVRELLGHKDLKMTLQVCAPCPELQGKSCKPPGPGIRAATNLTTGKNAVQLRP